MSSARTERRQALNAVRAAGGTPRPRARAPTVSGVPCDWDYLRGVWVRPDGDDYDARVAKAERAEELRWRAMQSDGDPHLAWAHENGLVGRERINRSDEAGDFTGLTRPTRNLFRTARAYREWARELSDTDATWEAFERMRQARWNARHRALHAGQRDHNVEGAGRLLPCETTALDSSRVQQRAARQARQPAIV
ncbi:Hypothetical protein EMIHUDRAFT_247654 [Emiliania huxleyi CCMP1516]|uniref:Uncharacterized protein n=2 Tax=Emiliania huxleyi TaxID=2903 RepID=A0A0D3IL57_EMIH1|nr:Hypothetical protein EMIHUDRAFT_247654 [Emiliania huxleyi CCMP1516]EOD11992.1 Hypothetical protein EMIHUDRAFT_247654 [Emiliania huxleyi CCMP1516]|eukprot:XP_005764421.1 Hypothetical protein EMIHUDRAFT_247654 [Emiliania huxleyi CCMP1516]